MTKEQILKEITDACVVANPEIRKCIKSMKVCGMIHCNKESHHRIVQLSDVLLVEEQKLTEAGVFTKSSYYEAFGQITERWNLKEPLSNQSTETLEFIYKLIK